MTDWKPSWNLASIPDDLLLSEAGRRNAAKRTAPLGGARPGAGRPVELVLCPHCGTQVTKTQAKRGHGCRSPLVLGTSHPPSD